MNTETAVHPSAESRREDFAELPAESAKAAS